MYAIVIVALASLFKTHSCLNVRESNSLSVIVFIIEECHAANQTVLNRLEGSVYNSVWSKFMNESGFGCELGNNTRYRYYASVCFNETIPILRALGSNGDCHMTLFPCTDLQLLLNSRYHNVTSLECTRLEPRDASLELRNVGNLTWRVVPTAHVPEPPNNTGKNAFLTMCIIVVFFLFMCWMFNTLRLKYGEQRRHRARVMAMKKRVLDNQASSQVTMYQDQPVGMDTLKTEFTKAFNTQEASAAGASFSPYPKYRSGGNATESRSNTLVAGMEGSETSAIKQFRLMSAKKRVHPTGEKGKPVLGAAVNSFAPEETSNKSKLNVPDKHSKKTKTSPESKSQKSNEKGGQKKKSREEKTKSRGQKSEEQVKIVVSSPDQNYRSRQSSLTNQKKPINMGKSPGDGVMKISKSGIITKQKASKGEDEIIMKQKASKGKDELIMKRWNSKGKDEITTKRRNSKDKASTLGVVMQAWEDSVKSKGIGQKTNKKTNVKESETASENTTKGTKSKTIDSKRKGDNENADANPKVPKMTKSKSKQKSENENVDASNKAAVEGQSRQEAIKSPPIAVQSSWADMMSSLTNISDEALLDLDPGQALQAGGKGGKQKGGGSKGKV